ncbi:MAG: integrase repeat-containing protein [Pseudomonadota bacterium]|nr:integrase repeat-containing protein [Pseudomonadota bacterium]
MNCLSYKETRTYLIDYWWFNPQMIENFEDKYYELVAQNSNLPSDPISAFRFDTRFFAFSTLFGEEFFIFEEAMKYCSSAYSKLNSHVDLQDFYKSLRSGETRLPSVPYIAYKNQWVTWAEFFNTQQLTVVPAYYSLTELRTLCIEKYAEQDRKPANLQIFFQCFKHEDEKIPKNPFAFYRQTGEWVNWKDLFGLESNKWVNYQSAQEFCVKCYQQKTVKPTNLANYYLVLREAYKEEMNLPRHPESYYVKTNEWHSFKTLFGVV